MNLPYNLDKYYKCDFGYPVRNLKEEPIQEQPLTPMKGEVLVDGKWIEGRWTDGGRVLAMQYDIRWSLGEIGKKEYMALLKSNKEMKIQLDLFVAL